MLDDGTLTHRGIHHLFADKFEGLQFTLQVIQKTYDKSESNKLQYYFSNIEPLFQMGNLGYKVILWAMRSNFSNDVRYSEHSFEYWKPYYY